MPDRPTLSPDTPATEPVRQTPRQRRIEEQRQKIETLRRGQRRKRTIWGAGILGAFAVVAALTFTLFQPPQSAQGRQVALEGAGHVESGTPLTFRSRPPSSGTHYPNTSGYGVFERDIETGFWVHTLEHGGVVVLYRPDQCDAACIEQLRGVYRAAPVSQVFRMVKMAVVPYRDMDKKIAAVAWGWVDEMDELDQARLLAFYRAHVDRGPEAAQ